MLLNGAAGPDDGLWGLNAPFGFGVGGRLFPCLACLFQLEVDRHTRIIVEEPGGQAVDLTGGAPGGFGRPVEDHAARGSHQADVGDHPAGSERQFDLRRPWPGIAA